MNMYSVIVKNNYVDTVYSIKSIIGKLFGNGNSVWRKIGDHRFIAYAPNRIGNDSRIVSINEKPLNFEIKNGSVLNFELLCNITKHSNENNKHIDIKDDDNKELWLEKKMNQIGFRIISCNFSTQKHIGDFSKNIEYTANLVKGEIIAIRDISPDIFCQRIGRGGAYGLGMLLLSKN